MAAAVKGYRMIITMPEKMSQEKVDVLKALGAEIIRTPTEAAFDSPESHISVANRLNAEIPNSHILDQYSNPANPLAHYDETAEEILEQCGGKVDMLVIGAGTGGTVTGIARKMREKCPGVKIVAVDPKGSILAEPASLNSEVVPNEVEGIGYDFIPDVLDRSLVDQWVKCEDETSFITARRMIGEEGLLCGGSSGSAMHAALQVAKELGEGQRCVVILPDSIRNYMSKFLNDSWMWERGYVDEEHRIGVVDPSQEQRQSAWWANDVVSDLRPVPPCTVRPCVTCAEAVTILKREGFDQLPVVDPTDGILGVVTEGNLTARMMNNRVKRDDSVTKALYRQFHKVDGNTKLGTLARIFDRDHFALVVASQKSFRGGESEPAEVEIVNGVVSRIDLLSYIAAGDKSEAAGAGH